MRMKVFDMGVLTFSSFDLPEDVFQPGETRPLRPKKKVVKKTDAAGQGQKRRIDEVDVSVQKRRVKPDLARPRYSNPFPSALHNEHTVYRTAVND